MQIVRDCENHRIHKAAVEQGAVICESGGVRRDLVSALQLVRVNITDGGQFGAVDLSLGQVLDMLAAHVAQTDYSESDDVHGEPPVSKLLDKL